MLFYQVQVTSQQKITSLPFFTDAMDSTYAKVKPVDAYTEYLERHIDEYAMQNNGYYLRPLIKAVDEQQFSLLACCKYDIKKGHDLTDYIKQLFSEVFGIKLSIDSIRELTIHGFLQGMSKIEKRRINHVSIEYNNESLYFDYLPEGGSCFWEFLYPSLDKEAVRTKAQSLLPDSSFLEEIERILEQDRGKFYGIPIHYKLIAGSTESAQAMVEVLVQALMCSHRLVTSRTSYVNLPRFEDVSNRSDMQNLIANNYGAVTVVELGQKKEEEGSFFSSNQDSLQMIIPPLKLYKHHCQMIFVEIIGKQDGTKNYFKDISKEVNLVEIKEGVGNRQAAKELLKSIVDKSEIKEYVDFDALQKIVFADEAAYYNISTIYKRWQEYADVALVNSLYSKYKPLLTTKIQHEKEVLEQESPFAKFNSMIGLASVKQTAKKLIATFKVQKKRQSLGLDKMGFSRHMLFTGNPGTAKTTVARLLAQIFAKEGITDTPTFIECGRADLVGQYVGQTAVKVKRAFERAKGGVLFIDEAYSLVDGYRGHYGDEAINTIVQEMENNRENTVVIFAGYPKPMQRFLDANEGLRSRIGFQLEFPDYNAHELLDILELMLKERAYCLSESAKAKALEIFKQAAKQNDFGNGRFVRNLLEQMIMQQSLRIYDEGSDRSWDKDSISMLTAADIPGDILPKSQNTATKVIGFNCA